MEILLTGLKPTGEKREEGVKKRSLNVSLVVESVAEKSRDN